MSDVFAITLGKVVNFSLKAKLLKIKSEGVGRFIVFVILSIFFLSPGSLQAQVEKPVREPSGQLPLKKNSIASQIGPDSLLSKSDTIAVSDSVKQVSKDRKSVV